MINIIFPKSLLIVRKSLSFCIRTFNNNNDHKSPEMVNRKYLEITKKKALLQLDYSIPRYRKNVHSKRSTRYSVTQHII